MKLSSKTITSIKMFIDLAEHYEEGFISLKDIAQRKDISKKFLEQIVPIFKNNGLLLCNRGNQGGYMLAKSPAQISLREIIYLMESFLPKETTNFIPLDEVLSDVDDMLNKYFSNISLADLVEKQKETYINNYSI